jgi:uncharacterized Zn finger protein (UPF0148 family)
MLHNIPKLQRLGEYMPKKIPPAPVAVSHLAKRAELSVESVLNAIAWGHLQAMELTQNEKLESIFTPHDPKHSVQGNALYIMQDEAERFVAYQQQKREKIEKEREANEPPKNIGPELQKQILQTAQEIKDNDPDGKVERIKILETMTGKKNNMYLYGKIKHVMDQHLEEYPPRHPNQLGDKLTEQGRAKRMRRG